MREACRLAGVVVVAVAAALGGGCGPANTAGPAKSPTEKAAAPATPEVTVKEVRAEALDSFLAEQKDKVVVTDFWATWCVPCVKKFPHLVELHKKYADKGLVCVSVSMDPLGLAEEYTKENRKEKVLAFLKDKGATFPNFILTHPEADEKKIAERFGPDHQGLPFLAVFDKGGRRVWDSAAGPSLKDEQLDKKIEELLAK